MGSLAALTLLAFSAASADAAVTDTFSFTFPGAWYAPSNNLRRGVINFQPNVAVGIHEIKMVPNIGCCRCDLGLFKSCCASRNIVLRWRPGIYLPRPTLHLRRVRRG